MSSKPVSLSKEEIERKYNEGAWDGRLPTYTLIAKEIAYDSSPTDEPKITRRRTETYKNAQGCKVLQRCIITGPNGETAMNVTFLVEDDTAYFVKRIG